VRCLRKPCPTPNYREAVVAPFTGHAVAGYLRREAPAALSGVLGDAFLYRGSPGQSTWADVPWIAVFDPVVTTAATRGYYVVYLFSATMADVHLTLAQGTTAVREEFPGGARSELQRRAALMRARLPEHAEWFSDAPIKLGGESPLAKDYEPSVAFGVSYKTQNLPAEEDLVADLRRMSRLYLMLTARGGIDSFEVAGEPDDGAAALTIIERRRYGFHRRIERDSSAAKEAKRVHGHVCQGCQLNFAQVYGPIGAGYIEAHHLTPLAELPEDVPVKQDPKTDFAVLCANCHRIMHRKGGPKTVADLRVLHRLSELRAFLSAV